MSTKKSKTTEQCEVLKAELLSLMGVRHSTHEVIAGAFLCRWCSCVVQLATGAPFPAEAHELECFAVKHLGRPVRLKVML